MMEYLLMITIALIASYRLTLFMPYANCDGAFNLTGPNQVSLPSTCSQYFMNRSADCRKRNLMVVPDDLQEYIQILDLSLNHIEFISNDTFRSYVNIIELYLTANSLLFIETEAFYPLKLLEILFLSMNKGLQLPSGNIFKMSGNLRLVDLRECGLPSIPDDILQLLPSVQHLNLESNAVKSINFTSCGKRGNLSVNLYGNKFDNITKDTFVFDCQCKSLKIGQPTIVDADIIASLINCGYSITGFDYPVQGI